MKRLTWMFAGMLGLVGPASPAVAQDELPRQALPTYHEVVQASHILPFRPRLCAPVPTAPASPSMPGTVDPSAPVSSTSPVSPTGAAPDFSGAGEFKGSSGRTSSVVAGTGLGGAVTGDPLVTTILTPLVIPGLFTSTGSQSAIPMDRVSFEYGYFNRISVNGVGSSSPVLVRTPVTTIEKTDGGRLKRP